MMMFQPTLPWSLTARPWKPWWKRKTFCLEKSKQNITKPTSLNLDSAASNPTKLHLPQHLSLSLSLSLSKYIVYIYIYSFSEIYPLDTRIPKKSWLKKKGRSRSPDKNQPNAKNIRPEYIIHVTLFLCFCSTLPWGIGHSNTCQVWSLDPGYFCGDPSYLVDETSPSPRKKRYWEMDYTITQSGK